MKLIAVAVAIGLMVAIDFPQLLHRKDRGAIVVYVLLVALGSFAGFLIAVQIEVPTPNTLLRKVVEAVGGLL